MILVSPLRLLHGDPEIPEGFSVFIGTGVFSFSDQRPINFQYRLESEYYFYLERIRSTFTAPSDGAWSGPNIELWRDKSNRPFQDEPVPLRLISTPGEVLNANDGTLPLAKANYTTENSFWWEPGSILKSLFTLPAFNDELGSYTLEVVFKGRYFHKSRAPKDQASQGVKVAA